jgi:hypothetical protein
MPERIIGRFSKVTLKSPPSKFKAVLQKMPITTLIAVSIAETVNARMLPKSATFLEFCIKKYPLDEYRFSATILEISPAGCNECTAT